MAFKRNVGTAYMMVLPDMSQFQAKMRDGLARVSNDAQRLLGDAFRNGVRDGLNHSGPTVQTLGQNIQAATADATQNGVATGMAAGAQQGAQNAQANVSGTVQNATQQGAQAGAQQGTQQGVTTGARQGAQRAQHNIRGSAASGVSAGLKVGFAALAGIAAAAVAAAGISALFAGAVTEGLAQGFETSKISGRMALSVEEDEALAKAVTKLGRKSIYERESIRAAAESVARADRGLLKDQKAFEEAVSSVSLLVDMYDMDPNLLAQPLANFIETGGNIQGFADMVVGAIGSSSGNMEDILDSLSEYGSEFMGAEQHFVSLAAFLTSNGLRNTDVLADAVREMRLRASEAPEGWAEAVSALGLDPKEFRKSAAAGGEEWMEAFTQALQGAGKLGGEGFSTVLETLGGGPLGDYSRVFADLTEETWKGFNKGAAEGAATVATIEEKLSDNPITKWKSIIEEVKGVMIDIAQPIVDRLLPVLSQAHEWILANRDGIVEAGIGLADRLLPALEWVIGKLGDMVTWVGANRDVFADWGQAVLDRLLPPFEWIIGAAASLFEWVSENRNIFGQLADMFFIIAGVVWDTLSPPLGALLGIIKELVEWIGENEGITQQLATALGYTLVGAIILATFHMAQLALATIVATWPLMLAAALIGLIVFAIYDLNNSIMKTHGSWGAFGQSVQDFFGGIYDSVAGFVQGILDWIDELVTALLGVDIGFTDLMGATWSARSGASSGSIRGLATGGTVLPQAGGTIVRLAEAGRAETVVDTGLMNRHLSTSLSLFERTTVDGGGAGDGDAVINVAGDLVLQASSADDARSLHKKITEQKTFDGRRKR